MELKKFFHPTYDSNKSDFCPLKFEEKKFRQVSKIYSGILVDEDGNVFGQQNPIVNFSKERDYPVLYKKVAEWPKQEFPEFSYRSGYGYIFGCMDRGRFMMERSFSTSSSGVPRCENSLLEKIKETGALISPPETDFSHTTHNYGDVYRGGFSLLCGNWSRPIAESSRKSYHTYYLIDGTTFWYDYTPGDGWSLSSGTLRLKNLKVS